LAPETGKKIQPTSVNAQTIYLSSWWVILLKKLILSQVVSKFAALNGSPSFMTVYTKILTLVTVLNQTHLCEILGFLC